MFYSTIYLYKDFVLKSHHWKSYIVKTTCVVISFKNKNINVNFTRQAERDAIQSSQPEFKMARSTFCQNRAVFSEDLLFFLTTDKITPIKKKGGGTN